ncbi:MAG TPA: GNAT family N-acetyltransferase [Candidatus Nanopelagicaceae bacterium]|nr:GNAT family N-acetyltransferase [Candidatus Nanopelagicaceae bacterium]
MSAGSDHNEAPFPPWKILSESRSTAPSGFLKLLTRRYELPDGRTTSWDLIDTGKTVAILALTTDNEVILVRQYRAGPNRVLDEMPGGYVDLDESPHDAARRELLEETGYEGDVEILASTWLAASATTQRFVAVARNCRQVREPAQLDDEYCVPVAISLEDFRQHLRGGQLTDVDLGYLALDHLQMLQSSMVATTCSSDMSKIATFPTDPIIGDGITLRQFTADDIPVVYETCNDPEIQKWLPLASPYELKDAEGFVQEFAVNALNTGTGIVFAIDVDGELVGAIDISGTSWSNRDCGIGYWAVPRHRGRGHMTKALTLLSDWVLRDQGFERIEIFIATDNFASQKVVEKADFKREGICRNKATQRGEKIDVILYSRISEDLS